MYCICIYMMRYVHMQDMLYEESTPSKGHTLLTTPIAQPCMKDARLGSHKCQGPTSGLLSSH